MVELRIPRENANDDFVVITRVNVKDGDAVKAGDALFEFETSKASVEFEAICNGYIVGFALSEGMQIPVDTLIGEILDSGKDLKREDVNDNKNSKKTVEFSSKFLSKAAKLLIDEGKAPVKDKQWITTNEFKEITPRSTQETAVSSPLIKKSLDEIQPTVPHTIVKLGSRKRAEIQSLGTTSPFYNSTLGVSLTFSKRHYTNEFFANSILDLVVYETSLLLKSSFSDLNACFIGDDSIAKFNQVVPGIALDDFNNLTVVSLPDIESLPELSEHIVDVVLRFDNRKLKSTDLKDTTFTVTDLSNLGVDFVLPLINGSQGFILGITNTGKGYHIFGSFDHRVTDGKRFSGFLIELKNRICSYGVSGKQLVQQISCSFCMKSIEEERSLGNRGFLKINDGVEDQFICRNCFEGW